MANPEIDNYVPPEEIESEQQLTHYYKNIFTLKSGVQIEICTRVEHKFSKTTMDCFIIEGFIKTPLLVEKTVEIYVDEIAAIESIKDPCIAQVIPWPENETNIPHESVGIGEAKRYLNNDKEVDKPLANHKSDCAIHNNPPRGFSSEVTNCDCGAIVPCVNKESLKVDARTLRLVDGAGQDRTKPVNGNNLNDVIGAEG